MTIDAFEKNTGSLTVMNNPSDNTGINVGHYGFENSLSDKEYISAKENVVSPSTLYGYRKMEKTRFASIGNMDISDFDSAEAQKFINALSATLSPKSVKNVWGLLLPSIQMQDPELSINQALTDYKRLGYSDNWINQRLKSIEIRKDLTNEWKRHGLREGMQFATLTDIIYQTWSDMKRIEKRESA